MSMICIGVWDRYCPYEAHCGAACVLLSWVKTFYRVEPVCICVCVRMRCFRRLILWMSRVCLVWCFYRSPGTLCCPWRCWGGAAPSHSCRYTHVCLPALWTTPQHHHHKSIVPPQSGWYCSCAIPYTPTGFREPLGGANGALRASERSLSTHTRTPHIHTADLAAIGAFFSMFPYSILLGIAVMQQAWPILCISNATKSR